MGLNYSNLEHWARSLSSKERLREMTAQMDAFAAIADALTKRKGLDRASSRSECASNMTEVVMWRDIAAHAKTFAAVANAHADDMDEDEDLERGEGGEGGEGQIGNRAEEMDRERAEGDESLSESGSDTVGHE
jgi:hypothetical protein